MSSSILLDTKKVLGVAPDDPAFDTDIIMHINAALGVINQLGVGPAVGVSISDETIEWSALTLPTPQLGVAQAYIFLKTRIAFDPPATSFHLNAAEEQVKEYEWRLNAMREDLIPIVEGG